MAVETRVVRVSNPGVCGPTWTGAGTIICVYDEPRLDSTTQQRNQDTNTDSATYLWWRKLDDSAVILEADGDYFLTGDSDVGLCPVPLYYTYLMSARQGSFPDACAETDTSIPFYSPDATFVLGTRLYTNTTLTTELASGFNQVDAVTGQVIGYTPVIGIDSFLTCP